MTSRPASLPSRRSSSTPCACLPSLSASGHLPLSSAAKIIIGASREIEFDLRNDLFANLERQSVRASTSTHRTGDIMARTTNDLNAVRQLLGPAIMYSANTIFYTAFALPFILRLSPRLTLFAVVPLPIGSILIQMFGTRIHKRFERIQAMFSDISAKAQENFSGARLIRAFAQEDAEIATFETANQEYIARSLHLVRLMAMLMAVARIRPRPFARHHPLRRRPPGPRPPAHRRPVH